MSPISQCLSFILITPISFLMKSVPGRQIIICKVQRIVFIYFGIPPIKDVTKKSLSLKSIVTSMTKQLKKKKKVQYY